MPTVLVSLRLTSLGFVLLAASLFLLAPGSVLGQPAPSALTGADEAARASAPQPRLATAAPRAEHLEKASLSRKERILQMYLREGGVPGASYAEQKALLKAKGLIEPDDVGFVKAFQGEITFSRDRKPESVQVTGTEPVLFRDFDETGADSRVEMQFDDGSILSLGENTGLKIDEMVYDPKTNKRKISLSLPVGTVRIKAPKNLNPDSEFEIRTPLLVAGLRGTELIIQVDEMGRTRVMTLEGAVAVRRHRPGEPRPAPKLGSAELSALGAAAANEVMVVAGMITEALPGRGDALRTRITSAVEIRTAIQATVVKPVPAGLEKNDGKELPPGLAKKQTPGEVPPGLAKKDADKEVPAGLVKKEAAQASLPFSGQARVRALGGAAADVAGPNANQSANAPGSRQVVPVAAVGVTRFKVQTLAHESVTRTSRTVSRTAAQEAKSLAKNAVNEAVKAHAGAAAKESGKAIARSAIQESVSSIAKETAIRSAKEQASTVAKEQASHAAQRAAQEAAATAAKEAAGSGAKEVASQAAKEASSSAAKEQANSAIKEHANNAAKEQANNAAKEQASNAAKEQANNAAKEQTNNTAKEQADNAAKENAKDNAKDQGKGKGKS